MTYEGWKDSAARSLCLLGGLCVITIPCNVLRAQTTESWPVAAVGDLDGDGNDDILWRDDITGSLFFWMMNGMQVLNAGPGGIINPSSELDLCSDLNADGRADLVWRNTITGDLTVWFMDGMDVAGTAALGRFKEPSWRVIAAGDADADGDLDLYMYHADTGAVSLWFFNGAFTSTTMVIDDATDITWQFAGSGDFNADGIVDLAWHHEATAAGHAWIMGEGAIAEHDSLGAMVDNNWMLVGVGNFIDGTEVDICWQNLATGQVAFQRGNDDAPDTTVSTVPLDPTWRYAGAGDFNGDGLDDVIWQHPLSRHTQLWMAGATNPTGIHELPTCVPCGVPPRPRYLLAGIGDYDDLDPQVPLHVELLDILDQYNVQMTHIFTAGSVDPDKDGFIDVTLFAGRILFLVPEDYDGFAAIDIETPYFNWLKTGPGNPNYEQAVEQMALAIGLAKALRPNAKWSFYGIPRLRRWHHDPEDIVIAAAPKEIYDQLDWFGPTIYDPYDTSYPPLFQQNHIEHTTDLIALCRDLADGRPVIPWVWHRRHPGGSQFELPAYTLLEFDEFVGDQSNLVMQMGADGVIWFNSDQFYVFDIMLEDPPYPPGHHHYNLQQYWLSMFPMEIEEGVDYQDHLKIIKTMYLPILGDVVNPTP